MEDGLQILRVALERFNRQSRTADKGWSIALGLGEYLTTPHREILKSLGSFSQGFGRAQVRGRWRALVNAVMNIRNP
jgi:hypothetical protein